MTYRKKTLWFTSKKVGRKKEYTSVSSLINRPFVIKSVVFWLIFFAWLYVFSQLFQGWRDIVATISKQTVKIVAKSTGNDMTRDTLGNINVLIAWYAGEEERWWFLTDTVMIASYNPSIGTVTFLSVPRDLYVVYHKWWRWKLNGAYWAKYIDSDNDHEQAAEFLMETISKISGIHLQYYAFVSFDWFTRFIDSLDGITVDVPEDLVDPLYPAENNEYQTFTVLRWSQVLDGDTALKYARSRQTTSDFSRTLRQQQIIKSVVNKVVGELGITNAPKVRWMYNDAIDMVKTNVSIKEIIWLIEYLEDEKRFFSFVYTSDCDKRYFELTYPGCVLVLGNKEDYNDQSVMVPIGATPGNINYYKHTKDFAFWVIHNQDFLLENAPVRVLNGVNTTRAKEQWYATEWIATRLAIDLKAQAFNVTDITNHNENLEKSIVYVQDKEAYKHTLDLLEIFVDIDEIRTDGQWDLSEGINLILWNDYLVN